MDGFIVPQLQFQCFLLLACYPAAFLDVYADLKKEVLEEILPGYGLPKEVADYQAEVMDYNVPGGKLNRGLSVVHA
jgi:hypothetical protein